MNPIKWENGILKLIDQTKLPVALDYVFCRTANDVARAIKTMVVRGAPAIGASAAYGFVLGANDYKGQAKPEFMQHMALVAEELRSTRPTAVNLFWAIQKMLTRLETVADLSLDEIKTELLNEADAIFHDDIAMNKRIGQFGNQLVPANARILTHCNAGALATAGYGTALGVIRAAHAAGKNISVYADETRPLLQGARLTAWELMQDNIPVTLITDNMAGYLMRKGMIDFIVVGADRITANGDVANKIGTYSVAVLAKEHGVPFYVAAPISTIDLTLFSGDEIPIEERDFSEVTSLFGQPTAPAGVKVFNPAFDVTPNEMITGIITDRGVATAPYNLSIKNIMAGKIAKLGGEKYE